MAAFEFTQSESIEGGGKYCNKPGKYHCIVTSLDDKATTRDGRPIDGLKASMEICAGTESSQVGHIIDSTFYKGRPSDKDQGEFANKKLTKLAIAFGGQHSPGGKGAIDTELCLGRQIVVEVAGRKGNDDKTYYDIAYDNIFHVDDPAVADVPKDQHLLAKIKPQFRKVSAGTPAAPAPASATSTTASAAMSLDDL